MATRYYNRITLQKLEVLCCVVELRGVSRAAEHLIVTQPVVTAHLQSLQKKLGVRLFYRDGNEMRLTAAGEPVYKWARETLARTRELMRELDGLEEGERGTVSIAASMTVGSYVLPPVLSAFRRARPGATITLAVSDPEHAMEAVQTGDADFGILVAEAPPEGRAVRAEIVGNETIILVAAPDYRPEVTSLPVSALEGIPLVSSPASHIRREIVDRELAARGVRPGNVVIELGHPEAMKAATREGLGMCLLFRSSVERDLEDGVLREIPISDGDLVVPVMAVLRTDKRLSPMQRELLDAISERVRGPDAVAVPT